MVLRHSWTCWYLFCIFNYVVTTEELRLTLPPFPFQFFLCWVLAAVHVAFLSIGMLFGSPKLRLSPVRNVHPSNFSENGNKSAVSRHEPKIKNNSIFLSFWETTSHSALHYDLFQTTWLVSQVRNQLYSLEWPKDRDVVGVVGCMFFTFLSEILSTVFCSWYKLSICSTTAERLCSEPLHYYSLQK